MPDYFTGPRTPIRAALILVALTMAMNIVPTSPVGSEPPGDTGNKKNVPQNNLTLRNWDIPKQGMFDEHGTVSMQRNELHLAEGSPATGIRFKREVPRNEYEVRCEAKRTGGSDFFYGLTFPVGPDYCSWIVGGWGGTAVGLSNLSSTSIR